MTSQAPTQGPTDAGLTARVLSSEWQTMDTAPKDGTPILCMVEGGYVVATWVRHRAYKHCWAWMALPWPNCDFLLAVEPINWMPLPTPPTNPKGAA